MNRHPELLKTLRIIWAIALKDIVDGIKNRAILSNVASVAFVILFYRFLPALGNSDDLPRLMVYDLGQSRLIIELEDSVEFKYYEGSSVPDLEKFVGREAEVWLGIVLPADFDDALAAGQPPTLDGYVAHWANRADVAETTAFFEGQLAALTGQPVRITTEGHAVYPRPEWGGPSFITSMAALITVTIMGTTVVTHLMLEEKQTKTMDALLVSPASAAQVVAGKAVAGLFYCLAAAAAVFVLNAAIIVHWGLALLAAICGALFSVALGLFLGTVFSTKQQLTLWGLLILNVLLVPAFLFIMTDLLPAGVISVTRWMPTVALSWVFRAACSDGVPVGQVALNLGIVLVSATLVYGGLVWMMRQSDK